MPRVDPPNFQFNPTYFKSNFYGPGGMEGTHHGGDTNRKADHRDI